MKKKKPRYASFGTVKPDRKYKLKRAEYLLAETEKSVEMMKKDSGGDFNGGNTVINSFMHNWIYMKLHVTLHFIMKILEYIRQSPQGYDVDILSRLWERGRQLHGKFSDWEKKRNKHCHGDCFCYCDDVEKEVQQGRPYLHWIAALEKELSLIRQCKKGAPKKQMPQPVPPFHNLGAQDKDQKTTVNEEL